MRLQSRIRMAIFFLAVAPVLALGQTDIGDVRFPRMNEGQLFTVKLVPAAGKLNVYVAGTTVSEVQFDRMSLSATVKVGQKTWTIKPLREGTHFVLSLPPEFGGQTLFDLDINVRQRELKEDFKFIQLPGRP